MTHGLRVEDLIRPDDHDRIVAWGRQADIEGNAVEVAWSIPGRPTLGDVYERAEELTERNSVWIPIPGERMGLRVILPCMPTYCECAVFMVAKDGLRLEEALFLSDFEECSSIGNYHMPSAIAALRTASEVMTTWTAAYDRSFLLGSPPISPRESFRVIPGGQDSHQPGAPA